MLGFDVRQFAIHEFAENLLKKVVPGMDKETVEKIKGGLHARFGGLGSNDELLSMSAAQIAMQELNVSKEDIVRIAKLFGRMTREERNKITNIIGADEQVVGQGRNEADNAGNLKDQQSATLGPVMENMRGAVLIAMMAKMDDKEIRAFLKGFGALDTTSKNIKEAAKTFGKVFKEVDEKLHITDAVNALDDFLGDPNGGDLEAIMRAGTRRIQNKGFWQKHFVFWK